MPISGRALTETHTDCFAWALIPNHFHLLLRTGLTPIGTVMRRLLTGYAVQFNRRRRRHGHLFQNRYKSILCQFIEKGIGDGQRPELVGGGLIRSLGGSKAVRGGKDRIKGDERILGDGDFVQEVLESCRQQLEQCYQYLARGYDFDWLVGKDEQIEFIWRNFIDLPSP